MTPPPILIDAPRLRAAIVALFVSKHVPLAHAEFVADTLVATSLSGVDTHGVELISCYVEEIDGGRAVRHPKFVETLSQPALLSIDAGGALGVVAGNVAMRRAIEIAGRQGVAAVTVGNSNHFGPAGYYADLAAGAGMMGLAFSNSDALVAPFNGAAALTGTNPIAVSAPGSNELFHFDMATSQIAYSRVRQYRARGEPLPLGWAVDEIGQDTALTGGYQALSPLGGYKGQGLGMAVQILTALLAGMPLDHELSHLFAAPYDTPRQVAHCFIVINIGATASASTFKARLSSMLQTYRAAGVEGRGVLTPGDKERESLQRRMALGIPLQPAAYNLLKAFFAET